MDKEVAKAAMQFMLRAQLKGEEVPAFNAVMESLNKYASPKTIETALEGHLND